LHLPEEIRQMVVQLTGKPALKVPGIDGVAPLVRWSIPTPTQSTVLFWGHAARSAYSMLAGSSVSV
jgi:hypothetical protein